MKPLTERQVQRAIIKDLRKYGVGYAHVPNGSHLAGDAKARGKQMGVLKGDGLYVGFPDLIVFKNGRTGFFEVKKEGGKVSKEQKDCHAHLSNEGLPIAVVRSPLDAFDTLKEWGWL